MTGLILLLLIHFSFRPTFPQLYVNSKLIGGLDIVTEMAEDEVCALAVCLVLGVFCVLDVC